MRNQLWLIAGLLFLILIVLAWSWVDVVNRMPGG